MTSIIAGGREREGKKKKKKKKMKKNKKKNNNNKQTKRKQTKNTRRTPEQARTFEIASLQVTCRMSARVSQAIISFPLHQLNVIVVWMQR